MSTLNITRGKLVISANADASNSNANCRYRYSNDVINGLCTYKIDGVQVGIQCPFSSDKNFYPKHCPLHYYDELETRKITL